MHIVEPEVGQARDAIFYSKPLIAAKATPVCVCTMLDYYFDKFNPCLQQK